MGLTIALYCLLIVFVCGADLVVKTRLGRVRGDCSQGICSYKGLPYAETLQERFAVAREKETMFTDNDSIFEAVSQGAPCVQGKKLLGLDLPHGRENCLHANVWAPSNPGDYRIPIMFWIYGGGFIMGWNGQDSYDGLNLARSQNVTVVVPNYRLGIFGMFASEKVMVRTRRGGGMNMIHDLLVALQWTHRNVGSFGGNSDAITIFGESSGAMATCLLLASPHAHGLFRAAITQSGTCFEPSGDRLMSLNESYHASSWLLRQIGLSEDAVEIMDATDLQDKIDEKIALLDLLNKGPTAAVDGHILQARPKLGDLRKVELEAMVWGYTSGDFPEAFTPPQEGVEEFLEKRFGKSTTAILLSSYPAAALDKPNDMFLDACERCQALRAAQATSQSPSYVYEYAGRGPQSRHGADISAVFGHTRDSMNPDATPHVIKTVQEAWGRLARLQSPPVGSWLPVRKGDINNAIRFNPNGTEKITIQDPFRGRCSLWNKITRSLGHQGTAHFCFEVSMWAASWDTEEKWSADQKARDTAFTFANLTQSTKGAIIATVIVSLSLFASVLGFMLRASKSSRDPTCLGQDHEIASEVKPLVRENTPMSC